MLPALLALVGAGASVAAGAGGAIASGRSARAQIAAGRIEQRAANANAKLLEKQARDLDYNARQAVWRGNVIAERIRAQSAINSELASAQYQDALRTADVLERQSGQAVALANLKGAEFDRDAAEVQESAGVAIFRQAREGRQFLGGQRQATAASGFAQTGSELDRLVESASRLETQRYDIALGAARESRKLRYAGDMSRFEGQVAAFEGGEQTRKLRLNAEIGKFVASVDAWNSEQEAVMTLKDAAQTARNIRSEAADTRTRAKLTRQYGAAGMAAAQAQAGATISAGRMGLVSSIGSAANQVGDWRYRYRSNG